VCERERVCVDLPVRVEVVGDSRLVNLELVQPLEQ